LPDVVNQEVVNYYANNSIVPATAINNPMLVAGIEFWRIEYDFSVN
jgi:hypothetical protein